MGAVAVVGSSAPTCHDQCLIDRFRLHRAVNEPSDSVDWSLIPVICPACVPVLPISIILLAHICGVQLGNMLLRATAFQCMSMKETANCVYPCPCGYFGDPIKPCTCAPSTVTKYQKRISGPLLHRIDIHVELPRVDYQKLSDNRLGEASEVIRCRVEAARERQRQRFTRRQEASHSGGQSESRLSNIDLSSIVCDADMQVGEVRQFCKLDPAGESLVRAAMGQMNLSARGYHRVHGREPAGADDCGFGGEREHPGRASGGGAAPAAGRRQ